MILKYDYERMSSAGLIDVFKTLIYKAGQKNQQNEDITEYKKEIEIIQNEILKRFIK